MKYDYLNDSTFLNLLHKQKNLKKFVKLIILSNDEKPLYEIQSTVFNGTLNINGNSSVRRTISLSAVFQKDISLELFAIDKKVLVEVGYNNDLINYENYGKIIWFPCGIFITSSISFATSTTGITISFSGQDKMTKLNGMAGGTLQAMTTFDTKYETNENGDIESKKVNIFDIIYESLVHLGGELPENIYINDLENRAKKLIKYIGRTPLRFNSDYTAFIITEQANEDYPNIYYENYDVGYMEQELIYPAELVLDAGSTIVDLLDKIVEFLGNYEYFYDVYGRFIFQEIKNYKYNTYQIFTDLNEQNYIKYFSDSRFKYDLNDLSISNSLSITPQYQNIKNDYIVWGSQIDSETKIRYHLAIDEKPQLKYAKQYMWFNESENKYKFTNLEEDNTDQNFTLVGKPCGEWREELYRNALYTFAETGQRASYYDVELLAEWRKLFDTLKDNDEDLWTNGWNPMIKNSPGSITYWLDFIDSPKVLGKFSVSQIGRRSSVSSESKVYSLFNPIVPDVIFIKNPGDESLISEIIQKYAAMGQKFCFYTDNLENYFSISSTGACAYDVIREKLYQHLIYNIQSSLSTIPRYYLEPNSLIHLTSEDLGIDHDFIITQMSIPLTYSGFMNITLVESNNSI